LDVCGELKDVSKSNGVREIRGNMVSSAELFGT
jgi:hypothetical protein